MEVSGHLPPVIDVCCLIASRHRLSPTLDPGHGQEALCLPYDDYTDDLSYCQAFYHNMLICRMAFTQHIVFREKRSVPTFIFFGRTWKAEMYS